MNFVLYSAFLIFVSFSSNLTENVIVKGYLKSSNKQAISQRQKILTYQGQTLLNSSWTKKGGAFSLNFCTGDETGNPIDFYTITQNRDTLLLASLEAFQTDGVNKGNFFLPKKGAPKEKVCPKCHQSDQLYTLIYIPKEQRNFERTTSRFYCSRERAKF